MVRYGIILVIKSHEILFSRVKLDIASKLKTVCTHMTCQCRNQPGRRRPDRQRQPAPWWSRGQWPALWLDTSSSSLCTHPVLLDNPCSIPNPASHSSIHIEMCLHWSLFSSIKLCSLCSLQAVFTSGYVHTQLHRFTIALFTLIKIFVHTKSKFNSHLNLFTLTCQELFTLKSIRTKPKYLFAPNSVDEQDMLTQAPSSHWDRFVHRNSELCSH